MPGWLLGVNTFPSFGLHVLLQSKAQGSQTCVRLQVLRTAVFDVSNFSKLIEYLAFCRLVLLPQALQAQVVYKNQNTIQIYKLRGPSPYCTDGC